MPNQTDLTIKNGANVDVTFTKISPAAGDGGVASWFLKQGAISSAFPELTAQALKKPQQRQLKLKLKVPSSFVDNSTGRTNLGPYCEIGLTVNVPSEFPESGKDDMVAYTANLINTALIKSMIRDALSAT